MLKKILVVLISVLLIFTAVACSSNENDQGETTTKATTETTTGQKLEGKVIVDGSGTVYPLMAHIAEEYMTTEQPDVSVQVGRAGSSAGFKKFIAGEIDFSDASRAIKSSEKEELEAQGLKLGEQILEFKLALDGLTIVINKDNTWAAEMTRDEIVEMYISGTYNSEDKVKWSDVRSEWPAEQINFYGPNENHGTYEFFWEVILGKKDLVKTVNLQQEYSTLVDLVANDKNAIAFFGFGYYVSNKDKITAVKVDFGEGPVAPSLETIGEDLPYKGFTRPVFTYLNVSHIKDNPQILDYAKYVVSPKGAQRLAGENGFAPLPAAQYEEYYKQIENITSAGIEPAPTTQAAKEKFEGKVIVDGSGTVYPLMAHIAEEYMTTEQTDVSVQVGRAGSSAGFKKFIAGEIDFSDASRAIKSSEKEELEAQGLKLGEQILEFKLALDGLTIVINKDNTWAAEMTREEIVEMYISGTYNSEDKVMWSDVRSDWPAEQINFYGPNENHGTYEFFWEVILGKKDLVKTVNLQQEYSTLVDLVANDKNAIAFFGFGYYVSNKDKITAVKVDFGEGPVAPSLETIGEDLPYKGFTRPVFTYLNVSHIKDNPQILDYAKYVVSPQGAQRLAGENGFAPLPAAQYEEYYKQLEAIK